MASPQSICFQVLGPVEVTAGGQSLVIPGALRRALLGLLLLHANEVVGHGPIVEALWGPTPPATAQAQVRAAISALRSVLRGAGAAHLLATRPAGYCLATEPAALDLTAFVADVEEARIAAAHGDHEAAADDLRRALRRWRGTALTGATASYVDASRERLEELRVDAIEELAAAELALGRHSEVVPALAEEVRRHPLREGLCRYLMLALHRAGRTAEALAAFRRLRQSLAEEHGLDPGTELRALEQAILRADPALDAVDVPTPGRVAPAQLPPEAGHFAGREAELAELAAAGPGDSYAPVVQVLTGPAGIGKTALALRWAHRRRGDFPDGQLFLDLRGHRRTAAIPVPQALRHLVAALGVPPDRAPTEPAELTGLFRSLCAGRRFLIVLDNAASSEQVEALLPGESACLVVVTSRRRLDGLAVRCAVQSISLRPLARADSIRLLDAVAGARRPDPDQADRLAGLCGDYPLALRIAAARLATSKGRSAADLVARLTGAGRRIAELTLESGRVGVLGTFGSTYQDLSPPAARLFRLLALAPCASTGPDHAIALCGLPGPAVLDALDELAGLHLLVETDGGRYGWHDLVRWYARSRAVADEPRDGRQAALHRLVDYYVAAAATANRCISPERQRLTVDVVVPPGVALPEDRSSSLAWLDEELANVASIAQRATDLGRPEVAWQLSYFVTGYCILRGRCAELADVCRSGLVTVSATGSRANEALVHQALGVACVTIRRFDEALEHIGRALSLFEQLGEARSMGLAMNNVGVIHRWRRRYPEALAAYERALAFHDGRADDADSVAVLLNNIGEVHTEMGDLPRAMDYLRRALAMRTQLGDRYGEAVTLLSIGEAYLRHGDVDDAIVYLVQTAGILNEIGDGYLEATVRTRLGEAQRRLGRLAEARHQLRRALAVCGSMGDRHAEAITRTVLGATLLAGDDRPGAAAELELAMEIRRTHPDPYERAQTLRVLGELARRSGRPAEALARWTEAVELFRAVGTGEAAEVAAEITRLQAAPPG